MYSIITTYDDGFSKSEIAEEINQVFNAAAIYSQDKECISIIAMNIQTKEFVIDFTRH